MKKRQEIKKSIYIFPSYTASARYYEKVYSFLCDEYEVTFVATNSRSLVSFLKKRNLPFIALDFRLDRNKFVSWGNIPIVSPLINRYKFLVAAEAFFKKHTCDLLIVSPPRVFELQNITVLAKKKGIPTLGLQWAANIRENNQAQKAQNKNSDLKWLKARVVDYLFSFHEYILGLILKCVDFVSRKNRFNLPKSNTDIVAVIDESSKISFMERFAVPAENIVVVGTYESDLVKEKVLFYKVEEHKKTLLSGLDMSPKKGVITVVSMTFNMKTTTTYIMDDEGQISYFANLFLMIREVFSEDEYEICFKLHPREKNIYSNVAKKYQVKLIYDEIDNEILIAISNLVVTHPLTGFNFPLITSGKPLISVNFSSLDYLDQCGKYYGIKRTFKERISFTKALNDFKKGELEMQYDNSHVVLNAEKKIKKVIEEMTKV